MEISLFVCVTSKILILLSSSVKSKLKSTRNLFSILLIKLAEIPASPVSYLVYVSVSIFNFCGISYTEISESSLNIDSFF